MPGVQTGAASDIYSFAKTCCYALFGTPQPLRKHWTALPEYLVELLENCLAENPSERPRNFGEVLRGLTDEGAKVEGDGGQARILEHYQKHLSAGISRSPVLKAAITKMGRLLDVTRLSPLGADVPEQLLTTVIEAGSLLTLDLRPPSGGPSPPGGGDVAEMEDLSKVYDLLDRKVRRHADLAKRETGVHALWLGYPLLHAATGTGGGERWILAPPLSVAGFHST